MLLETSPDERARRRINDGQAGFTLVELLVVLAIMGLIAALAAPQVLRYLGSARVSTTQTQLKNVGAALELYYLDIGSYPTKEQGLRSLILAPTSAPGWNGPYLRNEAALKDAWGRDYQYDSSVGKGVTILSLGRDGQPQGEGQDTDLEYKSR